MKSIRSTNLKQFLADNGQAETMRVMGYTTRQAIHKALKREIQIIEMDTGVYEARESKLINKARVK